MIIEADAPITLKDVLENPEKVTDLHSKWLDKCTNNESGVGMLGSAGLYE